MTEDCKRHFRNKLRDILDKLVRKYGCDAITPHVPATDVIMYKRLRNLRKLNVRKKKLKEMQKEDDKDSAYDDFIMHSKNKRFAFNNSHYTDAQLVIYLNIAVLTKFWPIPIRSWKISIFTTTSVRIQNANLRRARLGLRKTPKI